MKFFNNAINNGHAYKKLFPGATPKELRHYCAHTLITDNPNTVIINVGTNCLGKLDAANIANDIISIVSLIQSYGVNNVYVSELAYRPQFQHIVSEVNNILRENQVPHNYFLICNDNIKSCHLWRDKIHLNDDGVKILSNNFLSTINNY